MSDDLYLMAVVAMHRVAEAPDAMPERVRRKLLPAVEEWGGRNLEGLTVTGSYAKGTAIRGPSLGPLDVDVDLLVGLKPGAAGTLAGYQESLAEALRRHSPQMRNVAVQVLVDNVRVDLTVGRRAEESGDHVLWQRRRAAWIRTNVAEQTRSVRESGRREEMLAVKIWRRKQTVYFPSFCVELAVMAALAEATPEMGMSARFVRVLEWLAEELPRAELRDPANRSNVVSDVMTEEEKWRVAHAARMSLGAESLAEVV